MTKKIILSVLLLFCSFAVGVFAMPQYSGWGFTGYQYNTHLPPDTAWGSNLYLDNNMETCDASIIWVNQTIDNYQMPLILNPSVTATSNEIYMFNSFSVNVFDSFLSQICSYNLNGWNGTMAVFQIPNTNRNLFAYLKKTGTDYNVVILNRSSSCFNVVKTINISDNANYTGSLAGGKNGNVYAWTTDYNLSIINVENDNETIYPFWTENTTRCSVVQQPVFDQDHEVNDYNGDGFDDILLGGKKNLNAMNVGIFDTNSKTWTTQFITNAGGVGFGCSVSTGVIGSFSRYIIAVHRNVVASSAFQIYDLAGNAQLPIALSITGGSMPQITDVDRDGKNEFLYNTAVGSSDYAILSEGFVPKYSVESGNVHGCSGQGTGGTFPISIYCGWTSFGNPFEGLIFSTGFRRWNLTNMSRISLIDVKTADSNSNCLSPNIFDWDYTSNKGFLNIPVSTFTKSRNEIILFGLKGQPTSLLFASAVNNLICGDGSCDFNETAVTCPADCSPTERTDAILTSVILNPCNQQPVRMNTTINVQVKAEVLDKTDINVTANYGDFFLTGCFQTQNILAKSGATTTFLFNANCTGTQPLFISAKRGDGLQNEVNNLQFQYTINQFDGQVYGDTSCTTTQPLSLLTNLTLNETQIMPKQTGNSLKRMIDTFFPESTGLGYLSAWLIFMIIIGIVLIAIGASVKWNGVAVVSGTLVIEAFLIVLGAVLGFIPIGVIIVIVIMGILIGTLVIRRIATGSGD